MRKQWEPKEVTYLIALHSAGKTKRVIARTLGRSLNAVEMKVRCLSADGSLNNNNDEAFVPTEERKYDDYLKITGNTINVSDVHTPFWHRTLFDYLYKIRERFQIKQLVINGDFLNLDSFSRWVTGFRGREDTMRELQTAGYLLTECLTHFDKIYITQGNHEDRLLRTMQGQIPASSFFHMLNREIGQRIIVSDYNYCTVNDDWIVGHPSSYSERGGQLPADIADSHNKNVILGHNHQFGIQTSKNGRWVGIDHGMGADPSRIEYYSKSLTKGRRWQPGFSMIHNNKGYAFSLNHTDWGFWLK